MLISFCACWMQIQRASPQIYISMQINIYIYIEYIGWFYFNAFYLINFWWPVRDGEFFIFFALCGGHHYLLVTHFLAFIFGFWWRLACSPQITLYGHRKLHLSYRTRNFDYRTLADLGKTQELRDVVTTFATTVRIIIVTRRSTQVAATGRRRKSSRKQQKLLLL